MNKISKSIVSGFKFAEISNVIFSGVFLKSQIEHLNLIENIDNHIGDDEYVFVRKNKFDLNENNIIFCKTEYLNELFNMLNTHCTFKNIKLITHQSDLKITKKLFKKKPACISKWYSINVDFKDENLIPIPLGLANFHSKNLNEEIFKNNINFANYYNLKSRLLYLNFNVNTNFGHRKNLFTLFQKYNWASLEKNTLEHFVYKKNMAEHFFTLTPWGNGIDTHRFWEALYSGSIPVTKKHMIYESFKDIPKVLVNNYKDINYNFLIKELERITNNNQKYNYSELNFEYWRDLIIDESNYIKNNTTQHIVSSSHWFIKNLPDYKHLIYSKLKIFNRLRRFIYKNTGI